MRNDLLRVVVMRPDVLAGDIRNEFLVAVGLFIQNQNTLALLLAAPIPLGPDENAKL